MRPALEGEWRPHPWLARVVRWTLNLFVIASAAAASIIVGYALPPWRGWALLTRAVVLLATAMVTAAAAERVTRRLLPLGLLLELSVSVPDQLPGRFRVALRAARIHDINAAVLGAADAADDPEGPLAKTLVLLGALTAHDRRTRGHCERVRALNDLMAEELRLEPLDRERLAWAALLHDIGKLHVPSSVLQKPGALNQAEWEALQAHPHLGARIVEPLRHWLGEWADAVGHHHERWDGTGYPLGLAGEEISYGGRIIALVDAFEVMTSARPYKRAVSAEAARNELVRCAGQQFDPAMVRAFLNVSIGKLRRVIGPLAWLAQLPVVGGAPRVEAMALAATRQGLAGTTAGAGAVAFSTAVTMGALGGATAPAAAANTHADTRAVVVNAASDESPVPSADRSGVSGAAGAGRSDTLPVIGPETVPAEAAPEGARQEQDADETDPGAATSPGRHGRPSSPGQPQQDSDDQATTPPGATSSDPPAASSDPPAASSDPPAASSDPPAASSDPPAASSDPPAASSGAPVTSSDPSATSAPSGPPPGLSAQPPGRREGYQSPVPPATAPPSSQGVGWGLTAAPAVGRRNSGG